MLIAVLILRRSSLIELNRILVRVFNFLKSESKEVKLEYNASA
jgi:hypothetical protein